jgi:hypothetical protein
MAIAASTMSRPVRNRADDRALLIILVFAALLRIALMPATMMFHHPDELWQYVEPAYGVVTGRWIETWEYRFGIRSWLVPLALAGPEAIGHALAPRSDLHLLLVRAMMGACSLLLPWSFFRLGQRIGRPHAWIAGVVGASWFEIVYFADRPLTDAIALWLVAPALLMAARLRDGSRRAGLFAGVLLALTFSVRFQLAPALGLIALWGCGRRWQQGWAPFLIGATIGIGIDALADLVMGQTPFLWIARNLSMNLLHSRAASYGTAPAWWYAAEMARVWLLALPLLLVLALVGARRDPVFLIAALCLIAFHSAIAHKEYRFILLATTLLVLLAAIGTGDLVARAARGQPARRIRWSAMACAAWMLFSAALALGDPLHDSWRVTAARSRLLVQAGQVPGVCGVGIYRPAPAPGAADALINRPVPVYLFDAPSAPVDMLAHRPAFNVMIASRADGVPAGPAYRVLRCAEPEPGGPGAGCLFVRSGGCDGRGAEAFRYNAVLRAEGN